MDEARKVLAAASKRNGKEVAEDKIGTTFRAKTIFRAKATFSSFSKFCCPATSEEELLHLIAAPLCAQNNFEKFTEH